MAKVWTWDLQPVAQLTGNALRGDLLGCLQGLKEGDALSHRRQGQSGEQQQGCPHAAASHGTRYGPVLPRHAFTERQASQAIPALRIEDDQNQGKAQTPWSRHNYS